MKMDILYLNEVAQGLRSFEESLGLFKAQTPHEQLTIFQLIEFMNGEAGACVDDYRRALFESGLGPGFHPLWRPGRRGKGPRRSLATTKRGERILAEEDPAEFLRQYKYMMLLFTIADRIRRALCGNNCHHWWHHLDENATTVDVIPSVNCRAPSKDQKDSVLFQTAAIENLAKRHGYTIVERYKD